MDGELRGTATETGGTSHFLNNPRPNECQVIDEMTLTL